MADQQSKTIEERLLEVQKAVRAPKNQMGRFGKHRNVEGILAAAKPYLEAAGLVLLQSSEIVVLGGKNYVRATASVKYKQDVISVTADAWEGEISRGLDAPQVTGAATSYARKYALGGLLALDDGEAKDPDSHHEPAPAPVRMKLATGPQKFELQKLMKEKGIDAADQMTLFVESVINKPRVETEAEYNKIKSALNEEGAT